MPIRVDVRTPCDLCCSCCNQFSDMMYEFTFIIENLLDDSLLLCPDCLEALHVAFHSITGEEMD